MTISNNSNSWIHTPITEEAITLVQEKLNGAKAALFSLYPRMTFYGDETLVDIQDAQMHFRALERILKCVKPG